MNLPPPLLEGELLASASGDSNSLYYATSAEALALSHLQDQAIQNTIADHGLPTSDSNAVASWGRTDAEAELWGLLQNAINAKTRTADQQAAVDWLSQVLYREGLLGAYDTGLEYVKWAGLDQNQYHTLVTTLYHDIAAGNSYTDDRTNLENFMSQAPEPYNNTNTSLATAGYCVYQSPTPYQSDYTSNIYGPNAPAQCYPAGATACEAGCLPPIPSSDQFEKWGEADANNQLVSSPEFSQTAANIAYGLEGGAVAASVAAGVGSALALSGVMAGTAFQAAVFPFASIPLYTFGTGGAFIVPEAGAVAAAGAGAIVGAVLLFIVGTTIEVINLVNVTNNETNVANYVLGTPANSYNPASLINTTNGAGEMYSLFVGATLPPPAPASDTAAPTFPAINCLGSTTDASGYIVACLDPPPPPAPNRQTDPIFMVTPQGGTTASPQNTINWDDANLNVTNSAYLDGGWFVDTQTESDGTHPQVMDTDGVSRSLMQTLRIQYTDWSGAEQVASLFYAGPGKGYKFISISQQSSSVAFNPATCATDKTCVTSDSIQYKNASGKFSATVIPAPLPTISQTLAIITHEGSPSTLTAIASSPVNSPLTYAWHIEDKPLPSGITQTCGTLAQPAPCPPPTVTVSGNPVNYTFPTSGAFNVTLTLTDAGGRYSTDSFSVNIADVAPTLSLAPTCNPFLVQFQCGSYAEPTGTQTTLNGLIAHVGAEDVEALDINWGDGSPDNTTSNTSCLVVGSACQGGTYLYQCGAIRCLSAPTINLDVSGSFPLNGNDGLTYLPFTAFHTYAKPGAYTVTATVTDQSGAVSVQTATEDVGQTTTTLTTSPNPSVWGQPVTLTASVSSPTGGNPSGTVSFSAGGTISGCSAQPVNTTTETATCVTSALAVSASDSLTATYSGDSDFASSVSAPTAQSVKKATTGTHLSSNTNPAVWGQPVTLTATISATAPGAGNPSGTVAFKDGANTITGCGAAQVNTSTETATCVTAALSVASHTITADYSGDGNFIGSSSATLTQVVNKASVTATVTSANNPVTHGQLVTFTAQVAAAAPGAGTPTGTVTFKDGSTALGTASLSVVGGVATATFNTSSLAAGAHSITIVYSGDGNFLGGASPKLTQYINNDLRAYPTLSGGGYNLSNINLGNGSFVGENLTGSKLDDSRFVSAYFISANLSGANLANSNFTDATFTGVNFTGANLTNSNFAGATFTGATFTDANLANSNLRNANLTGAIGLSSATLTGANWNGATCPDGTTASTHGGTCVGHF